MLNEAPIFWPPDVTHWKRPWCWERLRAGGEGVAEDEMVGWHHRLNEHEFEQTLGDREGQGSLECYSPKESQSDLSTIAQYYPLRYNTIYNTQNNIWPNIWASHSPAKLTHEINHRSITNTIFLNYLKSGNTRLIKYIGLQLLSCILGPYLHLSFAPNMLTYNRW